MNTEPYPAPVLPLSDRDALGTLLPVELTCALRQLDLSSGPEGLYALAESLRRPGEPRSFAAEWTRALEPALRRRGCQPLTPNRRRCEQGEFQFLRQGEAGRLVVLRVSKIKVRRYGNAYRVDPHLDFDARWQACRLGAHLKTAADCRRVFPHAFVLFLGFADERHPFRRELDELQAATSFGRWFLPAHETVWDDPHGRGFRTLAACWHLGATEGQP
ncbi:MAG: hypothetical protein IT580_12250 [Verrucomicrobiales bacterium]|nr:hypothetical protein [Verrucomicrobiales bacterium]